MTEVGGFVETKSEYTSHTGKLAGKTRRHDVWTIKVASFIAEFICAVSHEVLGHGLTAHIFEVE